MKMFALLLALIVSDAAQADQILQSFDGRDAHTTRPFTVEGPWEIQWDASGDIFQIFLFSANGDMLGLPANQTGAGSGSAYQPRGGQFYLQINAVGAWSVTVVSVE